ncbi:uncharacterized protein M421DRAFT_301463 [Didymella exigua CBS 183.55]|uniref:Uncharacterized protein n=1 Tax=Didymella exigua CBS 183.55 TaxID=1150837 RepID=A0A6A5R6Z7_9PLEO|nr:uncharacterized protein M421DRAFT_301463 [Didymella exigua CBS 183.55]KAF1923931.1 hypothetical protein M421DRAFT_301463 [Didymella exigua CBS 183.55]
MRLIRVYKRCCHGALVQRPRVHEASPALLRGRNNNASCETTPRHVGRPHCRLSISSALSRELDSVHRNTVVLRKYAAAQRSARIVCRCVFDVGPSANMVLLMCGGAVNRSEVPRHMLYHRPGWTHGETLRNVVWRAQPTYATPITTCTVRDSA